MKLNRFEIPWYRLMAENDEGGEGSGSDDSGGEGSDDGDTGEGTTGDEGGQGEGEGDKGSQGSVITNAGKKEGEGDESTEGEGEGDDDGKAAGAPDSYEDFTVPEGYEFKPETLTDFQAFAKENNFSQDQAQVLIDYHAQALKQYQELQTQQWTDTRKDWRDKTQADNEIGGPQMDQKMANVAKALTKFGTPELTDMLDTMGIGDHPELVRFFFRVGGMLSEADLVPGSAEGGKKDAASVLYPNMA